MCKPYCSGGGLRMQRLTVSARTPARCPPTHYWQLWQPGRPIAAVFIGAAHRAVLIGVTHQLVGTSWTGATAFQYAGSIGPARVAPQAVSQIQHLGDTLAGSFGLVGLFGVDLIVDGEAIWPLEVNPRYTASVEVLELALQSPLLAWHIDACRDGTLLPVRPVPPKTVFGKAVLYGQVKAVVPPAFMDWADAENARSPFPVVADIPAPGTLLHPRHPICTVLACGPDEREVTEGLRDRIEHAKALLAQPRAASLT